MDWRSFGLDLSVTCNGTVPVGVNIRVFMSNTYMKKKNILGPTQPKSVKHHTFSCIYFELYTKEHKWTPFSKSKDNFFSFETLSD